MSDAGESRVAEAVFAGGDKRSLCPELCYCAGKQGTKLRSSGAQKLIARARRVHERAQDIENRADAQPLAHCCHVLHRWVHEWCEAEADSQFIEASFDLSDRG